MDEAFDRLLAFTGLPRTDRIPEVTPGGVEGARIGTRP
jgi:hypothetical protein